MIYLIISIVITIINILLMKTKQVDLNDSDYPQVIFFSFFPPVNILILAIFLFCILVDWIKE